MDRRIHFARRGPRRGLRPVAVIGQRVYLFSSLFIISSPVYAHGIEIIMVFIMSSGIIFGIGGGIASVVLNKTKTFGLVIATALYLVVGLIFLAYDTFTGTPIPTVEPTPFFEAAYSVIKLQMYGGVIPLIIK